MVAARVLTSAPAWTTSRKHEAGAPTPTEFTNEPFDAGEGPRAAAQRLWVLVGPGCAGTCEILASVLATHPQATVIGSPTAGSPMAGSGGAKPRTLAVSGFTVTVPTVEFALPGTTTLMEGRGVLPTVEVLGTPDSLANGDDLVLQAAIERIVP
jgi:C-terminal processing protease CtpA/Prc